jgi:hypothetical protein
LSNPWIGQIKTFEYGFMLVMIIQNILFENLQPMAKLTIIERKKMTKNAIPSLAAYFHVVIDLD